MPTLQTLALRCCRAPSTCASSTLKKNHHLESVCKILAALRVFFYPGSAPSYSDKPIAVLPNLQGLSSPLYALLLLDVEVMGPVMYVGLLPPLSAEVCHITSASSTHCSISDSFWT